MPIADKLITKSTTSQLNSTNKTGFKEILEQVGSPIQELITMNKIEDKSEEDFCCPES